jgi:hypothetical protein
MKKLLVLLAAGVFTIMATSGVALAEMIQKPGH